MYNPLPEKHCFSSTPSCSTSKKHWLKPARDNSAPTHLLLELHFCWHGSRKFDETNEKKYVEKDISLHYPRASMRCKLFGFVPCVSVPLFNFQRLMCPSSSKHRCLVDSEGQQSAADA